MAQAERAGGKGGKGGGGWQRVARVVAEGKWLTLVLPSASFCCSVSVSKACERDDSAFINVEPTWCRGEGRGVKGEG